MKVVLAEFPGTSCLAPRRVDYSLIIKADYKMYVNSILLRLFIIRKKLILFKKVSQSP